MPELKFSAWAPSNIALIKYMGKKDASSNLPENGSISMTLDGLRTVVELSCVPGSTSSRWIPEVPRVSNSSSLKVPALSENGVAKVLRHVERVKGAVPGIYSKYGLACALRGDETWTLRTANTFPQGSGIASSASSFAAVTLAVAAAGASDRETFERAWSGDASFRAELAGLSRQGSGSSCRSLDGPWVFWEESSVSVLPSDLPKMAHFVLLISEEEKAVSSSEAHSRVKASPLWNGRVERVGTRLAQMRAAIARGDLPTVARLAWNESWEMHSLFHTSESPFSYWEAGSVTALRALAPFVTATHPAIVTPPIVTMDAGPNVHVIVEESGAEEWSERLTGLCADLGARLLRDRQGTGASLL